MDRSSKRVGEWTHRSQHRRRRSDRLVEFPLGKYPNQWQQTEYFREGNTRKIRDDFPTLKKKRFVEVSVTLRKKDRDFREPGNFQPKFLQSVLTGRSVR